MPNIPNLHTVIGKASVLLEALPYLKAFRGKVFVIKTGGMALQEPRMRRQFLTDLLFLSLAGIHPVLVHGGGADISRHLQARGVQPKFVEGLRVTDRATLTVVIRTLSQVNQMLVKELRHLGARAVGLSGAGHKILEAKRLKLKGKDLGFVGTIQKVYPHRIRQLLHQQAIPVVVPLGRGANGQVYNINADQAAAALAGGLRAEKFVLVTDVRGILKDQKNPKTLLPTIPVRTVDRMIREGTITTGMIPKTRACVEALKTGVRKTHMIDMRIPHGLLLEIFTDRGIGTEIIQ